MNSHLAAEQIESYRRNGFLIVEDFLDCGELATWRSAVDEAVQARQGRRLPNADLGSADPYYNMVFTQRLNLWMDHEGVRRLMLDERLGKMAAALEGVEGIRIWHDQALIKEPWANPTAWHQDNTKWSFTSEHAISIWVALDDVTLQNGCLFFLPGTHRRRLDHDIPTGSSVGALFAAFPELAAREPVAATMRAGSCSFHNGLTAHGAHANMSPGRRRAMTCAYMPEGSTFNGRKNVLPDAYCESLSIGDVLCNDAQNPLIYSAVRKPERV